MNTQLTNRRHDVNHLSRLLLTAFGIVFVGLLCPLGHAQEPAAAANDSKPAAAADTAASPAAADGKSKPVAEAAAAAVVEEPELPVSLQPYLVRVELAVAASPGIQHTVSSTVRHELQVALQRMYGLSWSLKVAESDWMIPASAERIERLSNAEALGRFPEAIQQKVLLVSVEQVRGEWQLACREFDARVQELSPVRRAATRDQRAIADVAAALVRDSFRPVLFLAEAAKGTDELEFLLQAGELPPPDPSAAPIADGDVLRPFVRHMERRDPTKLRLLQRLDLTYVRVTKFNEELTATGISAADEDVTVEGATVDEKAKYVDRARVKGIIVSHGVAPFGGRARFAQQIALRQRPLADSSRVGLVLNKREDRPLVCYRVDRVNKLRYKDQQSDPIESMVTDRSGYVELKVNPEHPTCWLYVYSGSLLLARVPYAPGLLEQDLARLPDDSIRLGVEGELYLFRDQLVDVVAQRAVYKGIARKAAADHDSEKLESAIKSLDALPGRKEFELLLNSIRVPAINRTKELKNRGAERLVDKLCTAMGQSLTDFFNADKQLKELEDINELRRVAEQQLPATAPAK